jgi:glycosyltransferase involved in cell wall biosynthesis
MRQPSIGHTSTSLAVWGQRHDGARCMTGRRLGYVVSRFPRATETFILQEVLAMSALGWPIELFAIRHEREAVVHAAARCLEPSVHYPSGWLALASNVRLMARQPEMWARFLALTAVGNARSAGFLVKSLLVFPLAVAWAGQMQSLGVRHVHAHFGSYPALAALVAAGLQGIGFSFTAHAHDVFADNLMLAEKARRARFVVAISEFNRDRLSSLLAPDTAHRVRVIHCGVDTQAFAFKPRRSAGRPHILLSVAALREYKGLDHLIRACALLRSSVPEQRFVCRIVGEGPERTALEQQIHASGLDDSVLLMGACEQRVVRELLADSDVFVLPSVVARNGYMDGIPVALMEAMASGVPVIASQLSGIPELVSDGETGLLVPSCRAQAIHDAILRCWQEPAAAAERAVRARAVVEREYDVNRNTRKLASLFEEVLDNS